MTTFRYPSFEEMRALEAAAHRARSREMARLLHAAANALKSGWTSLFTVNKPAAHH